MKLTFPPANPSQIYRSFKSQTQPLSETELHAYVQYAKRILVTGGYVIIFTNAFTRIGWFQERSINGFLPMHYLAKFVCAKDVDQDLYIFLRNNGDVVVETRRVGSQPNGFVSPFSVHCLVGTCTNRNASYGSWPTTEIRLLYRGSKSLVRLSEKTEA